MKYELIGENDYLNSMDTIFNNRGITDCKTFLNLKEDVTHDWRLLDNIDTAAQIVVDNLDKKFFLQVDPDTDGLTSATVLYSYLKRYEPNIDITWRVHEKKMHGVITDTVPEGIDILLLPDSGSNQYKEHLELKERGITTIVLDHHLCEKYSEDAIVVNNQLSKKYPNKQLSGCGVVYKFCQALDEKLGINYVDDYLDLVAIGNIADSMSTAELETRYYIQQGLKNIKNLFVKKIVEKNEYTLKGNLTIKDVSWTIAPLVNSATRVGTVEENENLFRAFIGSDDKIYNKRKDEYEEVATAMSRILSNIRARQNRLRTKAEEEVIERIEGKEIYKNKIIMVNVTDMIESSLKGVVAIKIVEKYKKPVLLFSLNEDRTKATGSARGYDKGNLQDLRGFLMDTGKFIFCEGHAMAHGFGLKVENLIEVNNIINSTLDDTYGEEFVVKVDFIFKPNKLDKKLIKEINKYKEHWGKGVEEPLFAVENIEVNTSDIELIGKNKNTIKFTLNGIDYIKFYTNEDEYESIVNQGERIVMNVIGKASVNEYNGKITPQVLIEDYEVIEVKKKEFIF